MTVTNVAPTLSNLSGDTINEGDTATVTGNIADPRTDDTFDLVIDWGDGSVPEAFLDTPQGAFSKTHTYLDDPPGTETSYTVDVSVDDGDGGTDSGSTSVTVNNLAPTLSNLSGDTIDEGGTATVSGTITDPRGRQRCSHPSTTPRRWTRPSRGTGLSCRTTTDSRSAPMVSQLGSATSGLVFLRIWARVSTPAASRAWVALPPSTQRLSTSGV